MWPLLWCASKAVAAVLLAALGGILLIRSGVVKRDQMRVCSTVLFYCCLPCLLFSSVAGSIDAEHLKSCWILIPACFFFVFSGMAIGWVIARFSPTPAEFKNGAVAATAFGNTGYLPIPLVAATAAAFPALQAIPDAAGLGISYISVYLMASSPLLWTLGYGLISGQRVGDLTWKKVITPPVVAMGLGITVGLLPFLKSLLCVDSGVLHPLFKAVRLIGDGTVPLALLVLGAGFADGPGRINMRRRTLALLLAGKLVVLPLLAIGVILLVRQFRPGMIDAVMAVVLIIQAGVPPANNLSVMCNLVNHGMEERMAALLFWNYLLCIPTLTIFIMLAVRIFT